MTRRWRLASKDLPPVAVIADAHYHDMESHYDWQGIIIAGRPLTLRSWADTRRSSRVFNESKAALELALHDIQKKGIKHVVLLGDYSDDGQIKATERLVDLLRKYRDQHGTCFYAITGNHDAFGPFGKHQSTRFVSSPESTVLVTSDPKVAATEPESAILTPLMYCEGVAAGIARMSEFGLCRQSAYLYWESPFGPGDSIEERQYEAYSEDGLQRYQLVDASYLVEPVDGLWLLMLDANVFEPNNGQWRPAQKKAFLDSSDAGWNSVLRNRPHLIDWITDVCTRAEQTGKTLIAFSHYPVIDPFGDVDNSAFRLFGNHEMLRRKPDNQVYKTLLGTGLKLHFSGHLHISGLSKATDEQRQLEDCAVPSLAAFPACYKIVHTGTDAMHIDTVSLSSMSLDSRLMSYYDLEYSGTDSAENAVLKASNYGEFLYRRMHTRVIYHYLVKEWPKDIADQVPGMTAADLAVLMTTGTTGPDESTRHPALVHDPANALAKMESALNRHGLSLDDLKACSMTQLISDWYCLRHAGHLAVAFIGSGNYKIYTYLASTFGNPDLTQATREKTFFAIFLELMKSSLERSEVSATTERFLMAQPVLQ